MTNNKHSREEFTEAISRLKSEAPSALVTIEDFTVITCMYIGSPDLPTVESDPENYLVQWAENDDEEVYIFK